MKLSLKICGMRDPDNIREVAELCPDYMGFLFYDKSPRYVGDGIDTLKKIKWPDTIKKVGVYVDEDREKVLNDVHSMGLSMVQLHGNETPETCGVLKSRVKVMKAFSVGSAFDFKKLEPYLAYVDYFLFDTKGKFPGGNGIPFDWQIIESYPYEIPFFLSGGIGLDNVDNVQYLTHPLLYGIDVNSKLERSPGDKDIRLVKQFKGKIDKLNDRSEQ